MIHHLVTRKKPVAYPFPTLPVSEIGREMQASLGATSFKDSAEVSIVPKDQVQGFSKSVFQGSKFLVGDIDNQVVAACMVGYEGHRGWINYLAVDPRLQGRGLGRDRRGGRPSTRARGHDPGRACLRGDRAL